MLQTLVQKKYRGLVKLGFLAVFAVSLLFVLDFVSVFFWIVFAAFVLFKIDAKYVGQAAIACLVVVPLLIALKRDAQAEQVAVYAFFLLVITVATQVVELARGGGKGIHEGVQTDEPQYMPAVPQDEPRVSGEYELAALPAVVAQATLVAKAPEETAATKEAAATLESLEDPFEEYQEVEGVFAGALSDVLVTKPPVTPRPKGVVKKPRAKKVGDDVAKTVRKKVGSDVTTRPKKKK